MNCKLPSNTGGTIRLTNQRQRAAFCRREERLQGLTIANLADETGLAWQTVRRFLDGYTRYPRMETVVLIFGAFGFDVTFTAKRAKSRGTISLAA